MQVTSYLYPCLLYAKGDKYLDFFSVLAGRKDCSRIRIFLFFFSFFKGISGVNSGIIIISGVREEVFFSFFFLIWEDNDYLTSLVIFFLLLLLKQSCCKVGL